MLNTAPMFKGVWTAVVSPFNPSGGLDESVFRKLLRRQREVGVAGVVPCGTTGESPTLSDDEKKCLIDWSLDELRGSSTQVIAGTGSSDTRKTIALSKWASSRGVAGLLVVTPYYNKPSQAGLEAHFTAIADAVSCPLMLYNVPSRTAVSIEPKTVAKLARHPRITALKEATGNLALGTEFVQETQIINPSFSVLSGDDATFLSSLSIGFRGVVSVTSNLCPVEMNQLYGTYASGDHQAALAIHQKLYPLFKDLFIESNPVPIKAALAAMGLCSDSVRLPLCGLQPSNHDRLLSSMHRSGVL